MRTFKYGHIPSLITILLLSCSQVWAENIEQAQRGIAPWELNAHDISLWRITGDGPYSCRSILTYIVQPDRAKQKSCTAEAIGRAQAAEQYLKIKLAELQELAKQEFNDRILLEYQCTKDQLKKEAQAYLTRCANKPAQLAVPPSADEPLTEESESIEPSEGLDYGFDQIFDSSILADTPSGSASEDSSSQDTEVAPANSDILYDLSTVY